MEFSERFNQILISSKPCGKEDQSENNDLNTIVMDVVESNLELPFSELDSSECNLIAMDTDTVTECEVITKPEEAGGTLLIPKLIFFNFFKWNLVFSMILL